ncbi:MAG TPA: CPBP family intramembrane glutamic endopeptidase [Candidatus Eisenbacteria bacterium]|nr:CPBP family intramembrane glutamic endopeptidase [Candidatus Eisenbacteria bacterium]
MRLPGLVSWAEPALRTIIVAALALGLEWGRALAVRRPEIALAALAGGGAALTALGLGSTPRALGLSRSGLAARLLGGVGLGAVLLLPAVLRQAPTPVLPVPFAAAAVAVSIGEEVAFRGALYAAIQDWLGPVPAVLGSALVFTAGHVLSHPPVFLLAVAATGVLFATWRWAFGDLVAPIVAHCIADLAL